MRVIVATALNFGSAEYKNLGDVAMLQAAVKQLSSLWPEARIDVLTDSPSDLLRFCPTASPIPRRGCACWLGDQVLLGKYHQRLPVRLSRQLSTLKREIGIRWPAMLDRLTILKLRNRDPNGLFDSLITFLKAVRNCDLMLVCGSGGFADSSREWNLLTLTAMACALDYGKKVAMLGQGIGPLTDPVTLSWAKRVLPRLSLIGLRGTKGGQELLEDLGVSPSLILTTGDEAIELARAIPMKAQRCAIGINMRVAPYSEVEAQSVADVRTVLHDFGRKYGTGLLPIPIAFHDYANDCETIRQLLSGFGEASDAGATLDTPCKVIEQIARCRIVVTGAYHAAVFALAQGIPVICLSGSPYYSAKFDGLKELFPVGCRIVSLKAQDFREELALAMEEAWTSADFVRKQIQDSAACQAAMSRKAYQTLKNLVTPEPSVN
jgi:polysaccharide pyruvyl transferase WcaK-like protein